MAEKKKKVMLINVTHSEESRVAILSDGILESFEIETFDHQSTKGNIYKGRIETVHIGLQACFVDIGEERAAFLPLDEVNFKVHAPRKDASRGRIENHLQRGQELLVQVVRDAYGSKPPTLSTYFSLPGRFLVLTPFDSNQGISRKLDDKQREKIRAVLDSLPTPEGFGFIARTAGGSATKLEMQRDLKYLLRLWEKIEAASKTPAPKLIYQERSLVIRTIRDLYSPDISEILVDDAVAHQEIQQFFDVVLPHKKKAVKLYTGDRPVFNKHNLEEQIENIFRRRIPLPSGGALVFDSTEALTSVDVNSGKMRKETHIEETATKANLEAASEVCRQLRLRDLGGLVVIDFIDMRAAKNIRAVEKAMKDGLKKDKARYDLTRISRLGLMEISRQRLNPNKTSLRYADCPNCDGTGSVKTIEAAALQALLRLQTRIVRGDLQNMEVLLPAEVAFYMLNQKRGEIADWEQRYRTVVVIRADENLSRDDCEISTVTRPKGSNSQPVLSAPVHDEILAELEQEPEEEEVVAEEPGEPGEAGEAGEGEEKPKKKRRRRRRRRKPRPEEQEQPADRSDQEQPAEQDGRKPVEPAQEPASGEVDESISGESEPAPAPSTGSASESTSEGEGEGEEQPKKKRRRRRRRRRKPRPEEGEAAVSPEGADGDSPEETPEAASEVVPETESAPAPKKVTVKQSSQPALPPLAAPVEAPDYGDDPPRAAWWKQLVESA